MCRSNLHQGYDAALLPAARLTERRSGLGVLFFGDSVGPLPVGQRLSVKIRSLPDRVGDGPGASMLATEDGAPAPAEGGSDARQGVVLLIRRSARWAPPRWRRPPQGGRCPQSRLQP